MRQRSGVKQLRVVMMPQMVYVVSWKGKIYFAGNRREVHME